MVIPHMHKHTYTYKASSVLSVNLDKAKGGVGGGGEWRDSNKAGGSEILPKREIFLWNHHH